MDKQQVIEDWAKAVQRGRRKRKVIEGWVKALRSGKYQQGRTCLRSDDRYCVLGVLLDTIDPDAWQPMAEEECYAPELQDGQWYKWNYGWSSAAAALPTAVAEALNLNVNGQEVRTADGEVTTLTKLNDVDRMSFEDLSYIIESQILD